MRMAANSAYQAALEPQKQALRVDPFDNQYGEMERTGAPLPFTLRQLCGGVEMVSFEDC